MKRFVGAALILLASCTVASAQERWGGTYLGAYIGYGGTDMGSSSWSSTSGAITTALGNGQLRTPGSGDGSNFIGGLQIGYNMMTSRTTLVGVEADLTLGEMRASSSASPHPTTFWYANNEATVRWLTTFKGRAGLLVNPNMLLFATAGLALADIDHSVSWGASQNPAAIFAAGNSSGVKAGLTLGGGAEFALWRGVSLKAEYSYVHFNADGASTSSYNAAQGSTAANSALTGSGMDVDLHLAKVGLVWRF